MDDSCQLEHHCNATCGIIRGKNWLVPVRTIRVVIGPRTAIPMRAKQYSGGGFRVYTGNNVATLELSAVISGESCILGGHLTAIFLELLHYPLCATFMPTAVHIAWTEVALCLYKAVSAIGIKRWTDGSDFLNLLYFLRVFNTLTSLFVIVESTDSHCSHDNSKHYLH